MTHPKFIEQIDWALLKAQKSELITSEVRDEDCLVHCDCVEGLINLLDSIQDYAVDEMNIDKNEVFNLTKPDPF